MVRISTLLGAVMLLVACATTTLYTSHFQAQNSAGQEREFVIYWNLTSSVFTGTKASPVTLLTQCSSRAIQYEQQPVAAQGQTTTQIVFRGEPGMDTAADSEILPPSGICGRVLSANQLAELRGPNIEFTMSCKPSGGDPFAVLDHSYLQAREAPYVVKVSATRTNDLTDATPRRPDCPVQNQPHKPRK
ncbi:MAG: hypothetical protein KGL13_10100 [Gammaproteobacteria bacterium]|nr:hypothetical protein [Gammaproteobacteria bacterium]MDE2346803.1 hypothetical protein [Gammaproteobacteria bacterium]